MTSRRRRGEGANASVNIVRACFRSNRLNNHWEDRFGRLLDAISFLSLPATEYKAPGALRVFWNYSSVCPRMAA